MFPIEDHKIPQLKSSPGARLLGMPGKVLPHGLLILDRAPLSLHADAVVVDQLSALRPTNITSS
jgi:hypothetical protein